MIHNNMPINIQKDNIIQNTRVALTGNIKVIVKNQAGVPLDIYKSSGQTGTRIGNIISKLNIPNNAKITSISIEGKLYEGQEAINQLNNTTYGNQNTLSIVVNVQQQVNVISNIYLNNRRIKGIQSNEDSISNNKAILYFPSGLFKTHHITWVEINGKKFTEFSLEGNKVIVTGNIPVPGLTTFNVAGNFANGPQKDFPNKKPEASKPAVKPAEKKPETSKPVAKPAEKKPETSKPAVKPAEKKPEASKPAEKPAEKKPEASKPAAKPAEKKPEASKPAEKPAEKKPEASKPAAKPTEKKPEVSK
ncbi:MAG: hypothetical protein ACRCYE_01330, partial [Sarcina sp.]